jgi:hypothetical protein
MAMIYKDWPEQLEACQLRIAELEEKIASQKLKIQGLWDREMDATRAFRVLVINEQSLEHAQAHKHQIEIRLADSGTRPQAPRPDFDKLRERCDLMRSFQTA